ncbi:MAG: radical SAM protein [Firmicutes bacterium]|nr:radical SAM protein [Bacillota bacterium]
MRYFGKVFRPPSEAYSYILQVTYGCSHNKCTFCNMYKDKNFRVRNVEEVFEDIDMAKERYSKIDRIFLADGDALCLSNEKLIKILDKINESFPYLERIGIYATPKDILKKSINELEELYDNGISIIYMGIESGSDDVLQLINKGATSEEIIMAGKKVKETSIKLSCTLISGIGGRENLQKNALESARVISEIDPEYLGLLSLVLEKGTELDDQVKRGEFELLSPKEVILETRELINNIECTNCVFRSNHVSNYLPLGGNLSRDKDALVDKIDRFLESNPVFKSEKYRSL